MRWLVISSALAIVACAEEPGFIPDVPPDDLPDSTGLTLDFVADTPLPAQLAVSGLLLDEIEWDELPARAAGLVLDEQTPDELKRFCGALGSAFRAR